MRFFRLSSRELARKLKALGAWEMTGRGKGSHRMFARMHADGRTYSTTVPWNRDCVASGTLHAIRRSLRLTPEDGCTDEDFSAA